MRKCIILGAVLVLAAALLPAQSFKLDWATDLSLGGAGLGLAIPGLILVELHENSSAPAAWESINALDRAAAFGYNKPLDIISDVTQYTSFFLPALLAIDWQWPQLATIGVMYAEAALLAMGTKDLLKVAVNRHRPYHYFGGTPRELLDDPDSGLSFPSGHTTMAFAGAAFFSYVMFSLYPDSPLSWAALGGSLALASTTGVLRILSGNHFVTDVLVGAVIGSFWGVAVPFLHQLAGGAFFNDEESPVEMALNTGGGSLVFRMRY